jgi:predicted DNA-binding transcriptional regulator AlpA
VLSNINIDNTRTPVFYSTQRQRDIVMTNLNNIPDLMNDKLVDMVFITEFTGLSNKWFYKLIQEGEFPKPIKLGRSSRWLQSEIETWMQQRIVESRG